MLFKKVDRPCHSASDDRLTRGSADIHSDPGAMIPAHDPGPPLSHSPIPTPIDEDLEEKTKDRVEEGEKHDRPSWQVDAPPPRWYPAEAVTGVS